MRHAKKTTQATVYTQMSDSTRSNIELQRLRQLALSIGTVANRVTATCMGLSTEDVRIVGTLHAHPGSTATEVAKQTFLTPVQVGRRILRLKKLNYLVGEVDPLDARAVRLRLSPEGERAFEQSHDITLGIQSWAIRDLEDDEWAVFSRILDKLLASATAQSHEKQAAELIAQLKR